MKVVLHPSHLQSVRDAFLRLEVELLLPDEDGMVEAVRDSGVLVTFHWRDDYLDGLRWVQSVSAGVDQFPIGVFEERGIVLTSASGVHGPQMAEHAFALLLGLTRGIGAATRNATRAEWKRMVLHELTGLTVGILGLGVIGEEIARRAKAWDMEVIGTKRSVEGYRGHADLVFPPSDTAEVFRRADVVISVLPGGEETDGLVTREMLESLGGWFVNLGRGNVVDEADVVAALDGGGLLGAGLDVFEEEPLPADSPLWSHPRVVLTPHLGGLSPQYGPRLARIFSDNLSAFRGLGEWTNRVV